MEENEVKVLHLAGHPAWPGLVDRADYEISSDLVAPRQETLEQVINRMQAQGGTLTATVTVTRAATGKTETHTLVMTPAKEQ